MEKRYTCERLSTPGLKEWGIFDRRLRIAICLDAREAERITDGLNLLEERDRVRRREYAKAFIASDRSLGAYPGFGWGRDQ